MLWHGSVCLSILGEGVRRPGSSSRWGYPLSFPIGGTVSPSFPTGVPPSFPMGGGTPILPDSWKFPYPVMMGVRPSQVRMVGYPILMTGVVPHSLDWMEYPILTLDGGYPPVGTGWGYPPLSWPGMGISSVSRMGVNPPSKSDPRSGWGVLPTLTA